MLDFHKTRATVITFEPIKTNVNDNNEPISTRSKSTQPLTRAGKRTAAAKRGKTHNLCKAAKHAAVVKRREARKPSRVSFNFTADWLKNCTFTLINCRTWHDVLKPIKS